ncbi:ATP synthase F1 subunit gamma [Hyphobacterium sp. CCMP332]|nr:ATP synthase F1 subunit gamma [Hyphobacterium sp. CCMP332]
MGSLKEVRSRIASVNSTQQITKAMKMVSAAKLRKAQNRITQMRPYAQKLDEILGNVSLISEELQSVFTRVRPVENILLVHITSDKGLCGPFNGNINKFTVKTIKELRSKYPAANINILPIGKKGRDYLKKNELGYDERYVHLFDSLDFENVGDVADYIMKSFVKGEFDEVHIMYNQFKNAATQILTKEQFLPVIPPVDEELNNSPGDYIFEPSVDYIIKELIPNSLRIKLFKALLDSNAAEHGARMTAMTQATDNAGELLKELRLTYNRTRQAAITKEILEIVGGAEALEQAG